MASDSPYIVVLVYPNCRMRNDDNGVTFECEDPILFRTQRVETLSGLRSLILNKLGGTEAREIRRVTYRLLAPMGGGVFRFRLFRLLGDEHMRVMFDIHGRIMVEQLMEFSVEVGHSGGGPSIHSTYVQDNRPLAPPPIHVAVPVDKAEEGKEESDEDYVADSGDTDLSDSEDEDECVPETPVPTVPRISREAVLQGVKNYSIRRSTEYWVIESDRLKYHVQCRQAENGCQWSLRVALRQNLGYWCTTWLKQSCFVVFREVRRVGGVHIKR
ncbi:hypothetical protein Ahy_B05g077663 [Arachis hypogaea]|uniref:Uncharacterized protein n=1 Tax=Arachis hypogaea TaxID=3818 RepID=A0A444Z582_ARAHY|nr:hypothetical protein Ahy_B05g077663 [Arachis hypogaea]